MEWFLFSKEKKPHYITLLQVPKVRQLLFDPLSPLGSLIKKGYSYWQTKLSSLPFSQMVDF